MRSHAEGEGGSRGGGGSAGGGASASGFKHDWKNSLIYLSACLLNHGFISFQFIFISLTPEDEVLRTSVGGSNLNRAQRLVENIWDSTHVCPSGRKPVEKTRGKMNHQVDPFQTFWWRQLVAAASCSLAFGSPSLVNLVNPSASSKKFF